MNDSIIEEEYLEESYEYDDFPLSEDEVNAGLPLIEKGLLESNYKPISDETYKKILKDKFDIDFSKECYKIIEFENFYVYTIPEIGGKHKMTKAELIADNRKMAFEYADNIYFVKNKNFITRPYYLDELIEKKENKDKIKLPQEIIHHNKYLFNDSNSSLTWLMNNDAGFLESLVIDLGYVQDEKLLKWVFDNNAFYYKEQNNSTTVCKILSHRNCQDKLIFNQEVLDMLDKNLNEDYLSQLSDFISIFFSDKTQSIFVDSFSFEEKTAFLAWLIYWCQTRCDGGEYSSMYNSFIPLFYVFNKDRDLYEAELKKQGYYYNLPNFEKYWEDGKKLKDEYDHPVGPMRRGPEDVG